MRTLTRIVLMFSLSLSCTCLGQSLSSRTTKSAGSISGKITANSKGLPGVIVSLRTEQEFNELGGGRRTVTGNDGEYHIFNVPAGTYQVWPITPAWVVADASSVFPQGKTVVVDEGETVEGIDFSVVRGGVITGKVADTEGHALVEEQVRITPVDPNVRPLVGFLSSQNFRTDDRGIYRIYGVPAGRYRVSIGDQRYSAVSSARGRRVYPQTFYPDVNDETKASVVDVAEGREALNIDITVARMITGFSVAGRVIDAENDQPLANVPFGLSIIFNGRASGFTSTSVRSSTNGEFRIDNVIPGKYAMVVYPNQENSYSGESAAFEIIDQDLTGIDIKVRRSASLVGTVILEGTDDKKLQTKLLQLRLEAVVFGQGNAAAFGTEATINADGSFQFSSLGGGTANITLTSANTGAPVEFAIIRIERDGVEQPGGLKIKPGEQITGIRIVVAYSAGSIRGTVKLQNGTFSPDLSFYGQLLRPGDTDSRAVREFRVDTRGHFSLNIPPGNYELSITAYRQGMRARPAVVKQAVVVGNGAVTETTITIDLTPSPTPGSLP